MQEHFYDTVTAIYGTQIGYDRGILIIILSLITDRSACTTTSVQMLNDGIFIGCMNGQFENIDRINLLCTAFVDRINVCGRGSRVINSPSPFVRIAIANRILRCEHIRLRSGSIYADAQGVRTVAAILVLVSIDIKSFSADSLAMP